MELKIDTGLGLAGLPADHRLHGVLRAALPRPGDRSDDHPPHWPATQFRLDRAPVFMEASEAQQTAVLDRVGRALLEEAYFIEKAGMAFAAKMLLLSSTTEERMLYALFAGEESRHLGAITGFLPRPPDTPDGQPFLGMLAGVIEEGDRPSLQLIVQVVLEGWGLTHYRDLKLGCQSPRLAEVLGGILLDETRHHGAGLLLFDDAPFPPESEAYSADVMRRFLEMVRAGPQMVIGAVDETIGLTRPQRLELFQALDGEAQSAARLALLQRLMTKAKPARSLTRALEERGLFRPRAAKECV